MQLIAESAVDSVTFPDTDPGCWKSMFLPSQPAYNGVRIDPGNSLAGEYAILPVAFDPEDIRECWPAGTYRFAHPYWLDSSPVSSPSGTPFGWDLEVRISEFAAISIASSDLSWESA